MARANITESGRLSVGPGDEFSAGASAEAGQFVEYDRYIQKQLGKAQSQVKAVDFAASMITLTAAIVVYLLAVVLLDHWVITGGLGRASRWLALLVFSTGALAYLWVVVGPLVLRRINPVYAAHTIEGRRPALKNSLINFLLLRGKRAELPPVIFEAIEEQAATGLSQMPVESVVDRSKLILLGWCLAAVVAIAAIYKVASPKDPLRSIGRVVAPWADLSPPTRVVIDDVQPRDLQAFHDQHIAVSAAVHGVAAGEPVRLFYTTADGQMVEQPIDMRARDNLRRFVADLPPGAGGLQQDLEYFIAAGDARSPRYKIQVLTAPSIVVESVEYKYPPYTELGTRQVERLGDIKAIEGTEVTVRAAANDSIRSAYVDFDCDGRRDLRMVGKDRQASVSFPLLLARGSDRPEHPSYQLRFSNAAGHENPEPIRHQIEIVRDLPPAVAFTQPKVDPASEQPLAAGEPVRLTIEASDPDFKLARVDLQIEKNGQPLPAEPMLLGPQAGRFQRNHLLDAGRLGFQAGDTLVYWAVAEDNRQPEPNRAETAKFTLRIVSPTGRPPAEAPPQDRLAQRPGRPNGQEGQRQNQPDQQPADNPADQAAKSERQENAEPKQPGQPDSTQKKGAEGQTAQPSQPGERRLDPDKDPGQAVDEINKHFDEQQQKPGDPRGAGPNHAQQPGEQPREPTPRDDRPNQPSPPRPDGDPQPQAAPSDADRPQEQQHQEQGAGAAPQDAAGSNSAGNDRQAGESSSSPSQKQQPGGAGQSRSNRDAQPAGEPPKGPSGQNGASQARSTPGQPGSAADTDSAANNDKQTGEPSGKGPGGQPKDPSSASPSPPKESPAGQQARPGNSSTQLKPGAGSASNNPKTQSSGASGEATKPGENSNPGESPKPAESTKAGESTTPGGAPQPKNLPPSANSAAGGKSPAGNQPGQPNPAGQDPRQPKSGQPHAEPKAPGAPRPGGTDAVPTQPQGANPRTKPATADDRPANDPAATDKPGDAGQATGANKQQQQQEPTNRSGNPSEQKKPRGQSERKDPSDPGSGQSTGSDQGTPDPQEANRDAPKRREGAAKELSDDKGQQPPSPSNSNRQSDSQGGESGDRSGGGKSGGGQGSDQQGTGTAGKTTPGDEGGSVSQQTGKGQNSNQAGDQRTADQPTGGTSSGERGPGSTTRPSPMNDATSAGPQNQAADGGAKESPPQDSANSRPVDPAQKQTPQTGTSNPSPQATKNQRPAGDAPMGAGQPNAQPSGSSGRSEGHGSQQASGNPTGGGGIPENNPTAPEQPNPTPQPTQAADPNLEYARKATDLAIERLKDQLNRNEPDQDLLNKLKWTREDMERFVRTWEQMKQNAKQPGKQGDDARRTLDDALRNLGLRSRGISRAGDRGTADATHKLRESRRMDPPSDYAEQYQAYTLGTSHGERGSKD